ncbi:fumarate hydratase class I [Klebsiella pneumoniae]|uniref:Fumarate hydratase class I n=1 Tax=Klebsiella pneumoniae TaxID=573 RepID=A0A377WLU8_KLEPN|nr:fumarate hydratase class I [Klebsiella pneumoniae]
MSNKPFVYQEPFPLKKDDTEYYLLSSDYVSVAEFAGQEVLKVDPQALTLLAQHAFHDASFMLRPAHQQQVADILNDPEASENDKYVALQFLRNSDIAAKVFCPPARTPAPRSSWVKKASACGPAAAMKPPWRRGCITPISRTTCATRRTRRWICIKRLTLAPTCRRRSISMLPMAMSTNSSASPRAAARRTKPICTRKPKR